MRPIDGDALKERFEMLSYDDWNQSTGTTWAHAFSEAADIVENEITMDAVEVVRCKDCIWYVIVQLKKDGTNDRRYKPSYCMMWDNYLKPDFFCADGERRENEID